MMKTYPLIRQLLPPVLAILVFTALYGVLFQWDNNYTAAVPGGYGYCGMDTYQGKIGFLVEGWEFYPGELLTPQDFQAGKRPEQYTYVGQYPNYSQVSDSAYGVATYRLVLEHTPPGQALFLPELLCAGRVYINGMMVGEQGSISPYQPQVMDELYAIPGEGTVEVVVQCSTTPTTIRECTILRRWGPWWEWPVWRSSAWRYMACCASLRRLWPYPAWFSGCWAGTNFWDGWG